MDAESGKGKCDLDFKVHMSEPISVELRDWLLSDIFAELHCSQPKVINKISEEGDTTRDISLDEAGNPQSESSVVGVMRLETSRLILTTELQPSDLSYHKVNRFYPQDLTKRPEFLFKNHLI